MSRCVAAIIIGYYVAAHAQSSFRLQNVGVGLYALVRDWNGALLSGAQWRAEVYGGVSETSLFPLVSYYNGARAIMPFDSPGFFRETGSADYPSVISAPAASGVWLQVKVWDVGLGPTYEDAVDRQVGGYGESNIFFAVGGDPRGTIPGEMPYLVGLQSFHVLREIPEPSVAALLFLGCFGVCLIVRKPDGVANPRFEATAAGLSVSIDWGDRTSASVPHPQRWPGKQ